MGDFAGLSIITGFIEDGNSGDFFNMGNGLGLDGKIEFTAVDPSGMTLLYRAKPLTGYGSGTYLVGVEDGAISYSNGADAANVDLMGVTSCYLDVNHIAQTFATSAPQVFLEDDVFVWYVLGRRIDSFGGTINPSGTFAGTAHYMGHEFISVDFVSGNGTFADGNSAGFDASNGLVLGDQFSAVLTDATGLFDLVNRWDSGIAIFGYRDRWRGGTTIIHAFSEHAQSIQFTNPDKLFPSRSGSRQSDHLRCIRTQDCAAREPGA